MTSLSYDWYDSIPNLETLDLGNNDLSALPADVFNDFTNLKNLRLPANDLEALPADIFDGLSKLEELKLNARTNWRHFLPMCLTVSPSWKGLD